MDQHTDNEELSEKQLEWLLDLDSKIYQQLIDRADDNNGVISFMVSHCDKNGVCTPEKDLSIIITSEQLKIIKVEKRLDRR